MLKASASAASSDIITSFVKLLGPRSMDTFKSLKLSQEIWLHLGHSRPRGLNYSEQKMTTKKGIDILDWNFILWPLWAGKSWQQMQRTSRSDSWRTALAPVVCSLLHHWYWRYTAPTPPPDSTLREREREREREQISEEKSTDHQDVTCWITNIKCSSTKTRTT